MCLAIPGIITEIADNKAKIDYNGIYRHASTHLCENAKIGDRVLVHAGFIIQVLEENSALELSQLWNEIMEQE